MTVNIWNILGVQFILLRLFTAKIRTHKQVTKPITIAQLVVYLSDDWLSYSLI